MKRGEFSRDPEPCKTNGCGNNRVLYLQIEINSLYEMKRIVGTRLEGFET
jgi:hypothetical protein